MNKSTIIVDDPPAAFERFKQALHRILSVSKEELKMREEKWKKKRNAQHKRVRV